jgi:hypothetical protein
VAERGRESETFGFFTDFDLKPCTLFSIDGGVAVAEEAAEGAEEGGRPPDAVAGAATGVVASPAADELDVTEISVFFNS